MSAGLHFNSRSEAEREAMVQALTSAAIAMEMLRPENHSQTSDSELAALLSMADHAVHEVLDVIGSGRKRADATPKSPLQNQERDRT